MLVDALRKSMVAVCLANVLQYESTISISNNKSFLSNNVFSCFLSNENLVKQVGRKVNLTEKSYKSCKGLHQ